MSVESFQRSDTAEEHTTVDAEETPLRAAWFTGAIGQWLWKGAVVLVVVLVGSAAGMLYSIDQTFAGHIYPNITIRGLPVGEMTNEQAQAVLNEHYTDFLAQPLTIVYEDERWTPDPEEIGVQLSIDQSVQQAMQAGRSANLFGNLREVAAVWQGGLEIPLRLIIDEQAMQDYLAELAADINHPAQDARLVMHTTAPEAVPAIAGRQVLVNETAHDIVGALQTLEPQTVVLRTQQLAPVLSNNAVAEALRTIDDMTRRPLELEARDETWEWETEDLLHFIQVQREPASEGNGDALLVELDRDLLRQNIAEIADASAYGGQHPRVDWNGGDLRIVEEGTAGRRINEERAEALIVAAITGEGTSDRSISLPFQEADAPLVTADNLDDLGITDLLSVGRSDFTGSAAYRITNIKAGMALLDDHLLAPGEEFSFNETVGSINSANGFVEGYAIIQNRTQLEWGGGICQDSTTMFRAAFWAGLPFTERWGHSFYISWYDRYGYGEYGDGPGMDATIFTGGPDLRFVNDTGHWLLIQTDVNVARTLAEVRIYGTDTGRTIEFAGPRIFDYRAPPPEPVFVANPSIPIGQRYQSDTARGGMSIAFTRIIKEDGTEVDREDFLTVFKPWPNIYEVHPVTLHAINNPPPPPPPPEEEGEESETGEAGEGGEQPPAEQPPAEQPPAEQPPAEQPPAEQPPAEQPPAEQPPAEQPPAEQPPAEQPPAEPAP